METKAKARERTEVAISRLVGGKLVPWAALGLPVGLSERCEASTLVSGVSMCFCLFVSSSSLSFPVAPGPFLHHPPVQPSREVGKGLFFFFFSF